MLLLWKGYPTRFDVFSAAAAVIKVVRVAVVVGSRVVRCRAFVVVLVVIAFSSEFVATLVEVDVKSDTAELKIGE